MYSMIENAAEQCLQEATTDEVSVERLTVSDDLNRRWAAWLAKIGDNDVNAFASLYEESSTAVFSLVLHMLGNRKAAQETLTAVYDRVRQDAHAFGRHDETAFTWLITLARNIAAERLRQSRHAAAFGARTTVEAGDQPRRVISLAPGCLNREQRSIIQMTYFGGLTVQEVADRLGLAPAYVTQQICLAMRNLASSVRDTGARETSQVPLRLQGAR